MHILDDLFRQDKYGFLCQAKRQAKQEYQQYKKNSHAFNVKNTIMPIDRQGDHNNMELLLDIV